MISLFTGPVHAPNWNLFVRWHRKLTVTLNPNTDPNPKRKNYIYAVKDDTETNLHIVLYLKVIFLGTGVGL